MGQSGRRRIYYHPAMKYWINVVSREHVLIGVAGGFTQAQHGAPHGLRRLSRGDFVVFYSPRVAMEGEPLRRFTAAGRVADDEVYQVEMTPAFHPWRRKLDFVAVQDAPIEPLLEALSFIPDKKRWGFPFRRGLFEIPEADFRLIAEAMGIQTEEATSA